MHSHNLVKGKLNSYISTYFLVNKRKCIVHKKRSTHAIFIAYKYLALNQINWLKPDVRFLV